MKKNKRDVNSKAKQVALSGLVGAIMIIIMLLGSFLPVSTYTAPAFAGLCFIPIIIEYGYKTPLILYIGVSILSIFFIPEKEMALFFIGIFGYYPIVRVSIQKIQNKALKTLVKLVIFNVSLVIIYTILFFVFTSAGVRETITQSAWWFLLLYVILFNIIFSCYDILVERISLVYIYKIRKYFF